MAEVKDVSIKRHGSLTIEAKLMRPDFLVEVDLIAAVL